MPLPGFIRALYATVSEKGDKLSRIKEALLRRLEKNGIEAYQAPGLIKDLSNAGLGTTII